MHRDRAQSLHYLTHVSILSWQHELHLDNHAPHRRDHHGRDHHDLQIGEKTQSLRHEPLLDTRRAILQHELHVRVPHRVMTNHLGQILQPKG